MRSYGYLRVSTAKQDTEKNKSEILLFANEKGLGPIEWVVETASGSLPPEKRKIGALVEELQPGDTVITNEISRFGRTSLEVLGLLKRAKEKEINIYIVKGGLTLDNSLNNKIVLHVLALAAEIERDLISSRTKSALAALKAKGVQLGRPRGKGKSKLDKYRDEIEALYMNRSSIRYLAEKYKCTEANMHHYLKTRGIKEKRRKKSMEWDGAQKDRRLGSS